MFSQTIFDKKMYMPLKMTCALNDDRVVGQKLHSPVKNGATCK